ncbi:hypothetical protein WR25_08170 [Diploscapter pachys]|uniref:Calmodulin-binding domain-containing protein n=1 Tax=Diploscapter pachys TaxID=2018661 RepID=A0A2A2LB78_9BILA|nr:hypothetical protein WR25_08170 [Diploscapter pachys]
MSTLSLQYSNARMAAVRAAALNRSPRFTIYSSRGNDWSSREMSGTPPTVPRSKGYGVTATTAESVRSTWKQRKNLTDLKLKLCDWNVVLSISGLILAMIDVEMCAIGLPNQYLMFEAISDCLRILTIFLTILLLLSLIAYHVTDTKIYLVETGSDNWRVGLSSDRVFKIGIELLICAICPIPDTGYVSWSILSNVPAKTHQRITLPLNVLLALPMFLRLYIFGRYVVLHSSHYQDCATRTIASLNHVSVDFRFVVRSQLYEKPLLTLSIASATFWIIISWMLTQCERRMNLTSSEKRVNHLIAENQLSKGHKHAAARVLQCTWRLILRQRESKKELEQNQRSLQFKFAAAQRNLLNAILAFRKIKWKLRNRLEEDDDSFFTAKRAFMETEERLTKVRLRQSQLDEKLRSLFSSVQNLTQLIATTHLSNEKHECWKKIS